VRSSEARSPYLGFKHSEETRAKISAYRKGISLSEEHKANISASLKAENHPLFGKLRSEETRAKI
jgi:hypothetical protein